MNEEMERENNLKEEIVKYQKIDKRNNVIMVILITVFFLLCVFAIYVRFFG